MYSRGNPYNIIATAAAAPPIKPTTPAVGAAARFLDEGADPPEPAEPVGVAAGAPPFPPSLSPSALVACAMSDAVLPSICQIPHMEPAAWAKSIIAFIQSVYLYKI